ncbi:MAG TPA: hypothetical protein VE974_15230 [Thermoanaerobaculia bacterium]|nr:hypothetical protein [Thermoanaerobaculia bacterium]
MRRDLFAAGFWCALVVVALILVARREEPRREVLPPMQPPIITTTYRIPAPEPPPALERPAYAANTRTNKFHTLSCRYASCTNCTARFATRDEALEAGFRPGGCCNP